MPRVGMVQEHEKTHVLRKLWVVQKHEKTRVSRKLWVVAERASDMSSREYAGVPGCMRIGFVSIMFLQFLRTGQARLWNTGNSCMDDVLQGKLFNVPF